MSMNPTVMTIAAKEMGQVIEYANANQKWLPGPVVNVQGYGAKGDGVTDDTNAMLKAFNYSISENIPVFIPTGVYICRSSVFNFQLAKGQNFLVYGMGPDSILKRADGSITANQQRLFTISTTGTGDVSEVSFSDFMIDSNARGNPLPNGADPYLWQHCADIRISGTATARIKQATISGMTFYDAIADHVLFSGTNDSYVNFATLGDIVATGRTRTRSDITITAGLQSLNMTNVQVQKLEMELNSTYDGNNGRPFFFNVVNAYVTDILDISGKNTLVSFSGITANRINIEYIGGRISNSTIYLPAQGVHNRLNECNDLTWEKCKFLYAVDASGLIWDLAIYYASLVYFKDCKFALADPTAVNTGNFPLNIRTYQSKVQVIGCEFAEGFVYNILPDRCGSVYLRDNIYSGSGYAFVARGDNSNPITLVVDGGNFDKVTGDLFYIQSATASGLTFDFVNAHIPSGKSGFYSTSSAYTDFNPRKNGRTVYVDATVSGGALRGDVAKLRLPVFGAASEWMATNNHPTSATWVMTKQHGVRRSTTANRPTPSAFDIGLEYLDTTLVANGKLIKWTGTAWVDATGAVV